MNLLEELEKLIRFKTVHPNDEEMKNCLDAIKAYFVDSGLYIMEYSFNGDKSMVISNSLEKNLDIIFCGHVDVVPAAPEMFKIRREGSRLFARGAADMKSQVAVMMKLMLGTQKLKNKIGFMITTDEERGGFNGVNYLLENHGYRAKVAIVPDGGFDFNLVVEEKGVLQLKLSFEGREAHSAYLWEGENALLRLYGIYQSLLLKFPNPEDKELWCSSINLAKIVCENAINKVPQYGEMYLDIRHIYRDKKEDFLKVLREIDPKVKVEVLAQGEAFICEESHPLVAQFSKLCEKVLGQKIKNTKVPSSSDARFFSSRGMPCIIMNPICGNLHREDEWVDLESLGSLFDIYEGYCRLDFKDMI